MRKTAARTQSDGPYGYIDRNGRFAIPPQFDEADEFSDGLAHVRVGNKHGFIDHTGKLVFPLEFDEAYPLFDGIARVGFGEEHYDWAGKEGAREKIGYIDNTGKYIWKPTN
jgi:WG containing repeat